MTQQFCNRPLRHAIEWIVTSEILDFEWPKLNALGSDAIER